MAKTLLAIGTGFGDTMLVCALGIGIVFTGLAIIIGLVYLMNYVTDKIFSGKQIKKADKAPVWPRFLDHFPGFPAFGRSAWLPDVLSFIPRHAG